MHSMHLVVLVTFLWPFLCTAVSFRSNSVCKGDLYSLPRTVEDQGTGEQRAWHPLGCCTGAMWGVLKGHRGPWGWRFPVWDSPLLLSSSFKGKPSLLFIFNEEGETQVLEGPYQHVLSEHLGTSCWEFLSRCICCLPLIWENGPWARILVSSETGMHWDVCRNDTMFVCCASSALDASWTSERMPGGFPGAHRGRVTCLHRFQGNLRWKPTCPSR